MSLFKKLFLSVFIISVGLINLALFLFFYFSQKNYLNEIKLQLQIQSIQLKNYLNYKPNLTKFINTSPITIQFIQKTNIIVPTKFIKQNNTLYFQTYYKKHIILVWKKLTELKNLNKSYIKAVIIVNVITILISILVSYFLTKQITNPLNKVINQLKNYKLWEKFKLSNSDKSPEITFITNKINDFIGKINNSYQNEKNFIQEISHEIKTPLMQITSTLDLIENSENKKDFDFIRERISYIANLIDKLSFLDKNLNNIKFKQINLWNYLEELIKKYQNLAKQKNIEIKFIKNNSPIVNASEYYLDRLFGNLISNAINYTSKNWKITITLDKNFVKISDTGQWILQSQIPYIFDKFYKWQHSKGLGLWLSIVKKVIELLNWQIKVDSKIWKWTEFTIYFN